MEKEMSTHHPIVWILRFVAAYILITAAFMKFNGAEIDIKLFSHIGMEPHGRILIGILELAAAIFILIPQSTIYGAFLGLGVMTGAIIGHLTVIGLGGIHMAIIVFVCCLILIYLRRNDSSIFRNMLD